MKRLKKKKWPKETRENSWTILPFLLRWGHKNQKNMRGSRVYEQKKRVSRHARMCQNQTSAENYHMTISRARMKFSRFAPTYKLI